MEFGGRVALVTGASRGLGRRFALDLAAAGATVIGVARSAEALASLDDELPEGSSTRVLDVADGDAVRRIIDAIVDRYGRLDILINNAGIEERADVDGLTPDAVRRTMAVNFDGTVHATLAALPHMLARGEGWIVSLSSGVAKAPVPKQAAYSASKAAVVAFSESISYEVEPRGVKVKVLSPGFVPTTDMAKGTVAKGFKVPPRIVHRSEEQVSHALLKGLDRPAFEINVAGAESMAPVFRTLMPGMFRRNVRKTTTA